MTGERAATHHTAAIKDVRLHYLIAGSGDPVVLLHGWPQTWAAWGDILPALAERYTVIAPDLRGLGSSSKPSGGYDIDNVADDIYELVRHLGHERILLAGHDWGAATAYSYAAQHPDDVRRLAIFEMVLPGFGIMEGAMAPRPNGEFLWHMGFQSVPDVAYALIAGREEVYLGHIFERYAYDPVAVRPERMRHYVDAMRAVGALRAGLGYYQSYFTTAAQNEHHAERKLPMPVLAMAGEACLGPLTHQCMELAASDVRGGVIPRCGHWIGEERPDFIAEQLLAFFGEGEEAVSRGEKLEAASPR
jgi:pimeloyl-ACP methyl ester carboxylesterase